MPRHRLMGISPAALDGALQDQEQQYRMILDQLRSHLATAEGRLEELRTRKAALVDELGRLDAEVQQQLQAMDRLGQESERPRQSLIERHRRIEADLREGQAVLEREREEWIDLERKVAEGVMAAVQPYLTLTSLLPDLPDDEAGPDAEGGAPRG